MSLSQPANMLHQSIDLVERYTKCLLQDFKNNSETLTLNELSSYILHFSNVIESNIAIKNIFEEFVNIIDSSSEELDCENILRQFNEQINSVKKTIKNPEHNEKYVSYLKLISQNNLNNGDEVIAVSETVNLIDPISKLPIVEPVKNKKCGHVYEKTTIYQFIDRNAKTKCPIAGCNVTDFVKKSDLVPDNSMKRILTNHSNESLKKKLKTDK